MSRWLISNTLVARIKFQHIMRKIIVIVYEPECALLKINGTPNFQAP